MFITLTMGQWTYHLTLISSRNPAAVLCEKGSKTHTFPQN